MKHLRLVLAILALFAVPCAAWAHEVRPAYLEIVETAPDTYDILWRTPVFSGMRLPVVLQLPDDAHDTMEPVTQRLSDSLVEHRRIETGPDGLAGRRIDFIGLQATITDVLVRVTWRDGVETTTIVRPSEPWIVLASEQTAWQVAREYTEMGVEHILLGIDHLLFVLALLIITRGVWRLVKTVTAFTVAHSITLGLAALGFVQVPSRPVEALIALSIVFVAAEIVHVQRGVQGLTARAPWIVAFLFGLLHGFGFAGALSEVGLPQGNIPLALLFFNVGVELGQLTFIFAVLACLWLVRHAGIAWPRWAVLVPAYAIGSVAMLWLLERVLIV